MTLSTRTAEETEAVGAALGRLVAPGDVLALQGDLGAGKTVFVKGLARGLGVPPSVNVTSPSFTLINEYRGGRLTLWHVDLYRLDREDELIQLGWDDLLRQDGVVAVEWADRFPTALPAERLEVILRVTGEEAREIIARPHGPRAQALAAAWRQECP